MSPTVDIRTAAWERFDYHIGETDPPIRDTFAQGVLGVLLKAHSKSPDTIAERVEEVLEFTEHLTATQLAHYFRVACLQENPTKTQRKMLEKQSVIAIMGTTVKARDLVYTLAKTSYHDIGCRTLGNNMRLFYSQVDLELADREDDRPLPARFVYRCKVFRPEGVKPKVSYKWMREFGDLPGARTKLIQEVFVEGKHGTSVFTVPNSDAVELVEIIRL